MEVTYFACVLTRSMSAERSSPSSDDIASPLTLVSDGSSYASRLYNSSYNARTTRDTCRCQIEATATREHIFANSARAAFTTPSANKSLYSRTLICSDDCFVPSVAALEHPALYVCGPTAPFQDLLAQHYPSRNTLTQGIRIMGTPSRPPGYGVARLFKSILPLRKFQLYGDLRTATAWTRRRSHKRRTSTEFCRIR